MNQSYSLGERTSRLFLYSGLGFGAAFLLFSVVTNYLSSVSHYHDRYVAQLDFFAEQLRGPLAFNDLDSTMAAINALKRDDSIHALQIFVKSQDELSKNTTRRWVYQSNEAGQAELGCQSSGDFLSGFMQMEFETTFSVLKNSQAHICMHVHLNALLESWLSNLLAGLFAFSLFGFIWWRFTWRIKEDLASVFERLNRGFSQVKDKGLEQSTQLDLSDIKELKPLVAVFNHMLEELRHRQKSLLHNQQLTSLGRVAMGAAHEVGNPLMCISTLIEDMEREWQTKGAFSFEKSQLIRQQVRRIETILNLMNRYGKPFAYPHQIPLTSANLLAEAQQAVDLLKMDSRYKLCQPKVKLDISSKIFVSVDVERLRQILINLFNNALDACWEGGEIGLSWLEVGDFAPCLRIADTGLGIKPDKLEQIFEPFFTEKQKFLGTGLGLWLSRELMRAMGGEIVIHSQWGQGTQVYLQFKQGDGDGKTRSASS
jgi:signal transduction histidine kinase